MRLVGRFFACHPTLSSHFLAKRLEKKSPETAEKAHQACLEYLEKVMQAPAVVKELGRNRGISR